MWGFMSGSAEPPPKPPGRAKTPPLVAEVAAPLAEPTDALVPELDTAIAAELPPEPGVEAAVPVDVEAALAAVPTAPLDAPVDTEPFEQPTGPILALAMNTAPVEEPAVAPTAAPMAEPAKEATAEHIIDVGVLTVEAPAEAPAEAIIEAPTAAPVVAPLQQTDSMHAIASTLLAAVEASQRTAQSANDCAERVHRIKESAIQKAVFHAGQDTCTAIRKSFNAVLDDTSTALHTRAVTSAEAAVGAALERFESSVDAVVSTTVEAKVDRIVKSAIKTRIEDTLAPAISATVDAAMARALDGALETHLHDSAERAILTVIGDLRTAMEGAAIRAITEALKDRVVLAHEATAATVATNVSDTTLADQLAAARSSTPRKPASTATAAAAVAAAERVVGELAAPTPDDDEQPVEAPVPARPTVAQALLTPGASPLLPPPPSMDDLPAWQPMPGVAEASQPPARPRRARA